MAIQTGSAYISESMIDVVEILTANLGFTSIESSVKVSLTSLSDCDNDGQPEIAR